MSTQTSFVLALVVLLLIVNRDPQSANRNGRGDRPGRFQYEESRNSTTFALALLPLYRRIATHVKRIPQRKPWKDA